MNKTNMILICIIIALVSGIIGFIIGMNVKESNIVNDPAENFSFEISSNESNAHDAVTNSIPAQSRGLIFSLNMTSAITAVATISKLFSSDAFAAEVDFKPNNRQIGAAISSSIMATV